MYRARLGNTANALRLQQDLVRARGKAKPPGSNNAGAAAKDDNEG
jgi:hypothetical protein